MLFQTHVFLLTFLPIVVLGWYGLANLPAAREWFLILASLVFYGWWDVRCLPILLGMGTLTWVAAAASTRLTKANGRRVLLGAIVLNFAVLAFFKYAAFIAENMAAAVGLQAPPMSIVLPIGISFYTFELVSYLIDLGWRGAPLYGVRHFSLFVTFFPRLIAGPIVRHDEVIPQFQQHPLRDGAEERFARGLLVLTLGLAEKVAIADQLAPIADAVFQVGASPPPLLSAWSGALAFTFQLFFDFAAYSQMAIGIALMLGIMLPPNFEAPYAATSLRDFWRRWHMTLSRYLRDYLYIPLGGDRQPWRGYAITTLFTMGMCGLWHGAGWLFVAWGLMHGIGLLVCRAWQTHGFPLPSVTGWALTFVFVVFGWVLFRAPNIEVANAIFKGMLGMNGLGGTLQQPLLIFVAAGLSLIHPPLYQRLLASPTLPQFVAVGAGLGLAALIFATGGGTPQNFIYFQF